MRAGCGRSCPSAWGRAVRTSSLKRCSSSARSTCGPIPSSSPRLWSPRSPSTSGFRCIPARSSAPSPARRRALGARKVAEGIEHGPEVDASYERLRAAVLGGQPDGFRLGHGVPATRGVVAWIAALGSLPRSPGTCAAAFGSSSGSSNRRSCGTELPSDGLPARVDFIHVLIRRDRAAGHQRVAQLRVETLVLRVRLNSERIERGPRRSSERRRRAPRP
jgi:hypothetical protein